MALEVEGRAPRVRGRANATVTSERAVLVKRYHVCVPGHGGAWPSSID